MKLTAASLTLFVVPAFGFLSGCGPSDAVRPQRDKVVLAQLHIHIPWKEAGLSERQAAAHLLNRFTFGIRPGDIDSVVAMGIDRWFAAQLREHEPDILLQTKLADYHTLSLTNEQIASLYPPPGQILVLARREGVIPAAPPPSMEDTNAVSEGGLKRYRDELKKFAGERGFQPFKDLFGELESQKLIRAVYGKDQLVEVLSDFWFNHFNVSASNNQARPFILTYERDAIRPFVLGRFRDMLEATAKHPAMLYYLDNARSTAQEGVPTTVSFATARYRGVHFSGGMQASRASRGINENYARELMELHTMGVDGGYTQHDVIEVARALTGWTVYPMGPLSDTMRAQIDKRLEKGRQVGFMRQGDFLFRAGVHDAGPKSILGVSFPAGGGEEEGERVLDLLVKQPSTAVHLSRELASRFVNDHPSDTLVAHLAEVFRTTDGNLSAMMCAIVESREFWSEARMPSKIKSPFELAVSALRALNADVQQTEGVTRWVAQMGEPLYAYQAPTGYPDRAKNWINTGSLLKRMNFGLAVADQRVRGIAYAPDRLLGMQEPESREAALVQYCTLLLPERDTDGTIRLLTPLLSRENLSTRQIAGLIIGSPEFQRH